ncbi:MAG: hypothetical protein Q9186_007409 [Xanthomendoza sp. 1 TL-2023]
MHLQQTDSSGSAHGNGLTEGPEKPLKDFILESFCLPFGQKMPLSSIGGPTYSTAQNLIQQVAYTLSDRLWTYSPTTFDLDVAVKRWLDDGALNAYGYPTSVESTQTRLGAASVALGYMFSKDFDLKRRHMPQTVLASASSFSYLQAVLEQLSLLNTVANPFVAHVAALDYAGRSSSLVTNYISTMRLAEQLGFALIASSSVHESQHMALFATLLASIAPSIHIYDGVTVGRETTRVIDVLDQSGLYNNYKAILQEVASPNRKYTGIDTRVEHLLKAFNVELGTDYGLFEYYGHSAPDAVLITFGTVESALGAQVASSLAGDGVLIGVLNVRVYRPFVEDEFLRLLPTSTKTVGVLGQVADGDVVADHSINSALYDDVFAAITFSGSWHSPPHVMDIKYSREEVWTPVSIAAALQLILKKPLTQHNEASGDEQGGQPLRLLDTTAAQEYVFWDSDDSPSANAPLIFGSALSKDSSSNIATISRHDNLVLGGLIRTDIRKSKKTINAPYPIDAADLIYIGNPGLLDIFDTVKGLNRRGKILLKMPGVKDDEIEKRLPKMFQKAVSEKGSELFIFDPSGIELVANDPALETYLLQTAFLRVGLPNLEKIGLDKLASINGSSSVFEELATHLEKALRRIEVPVEWKALEIDSGSLALPSDINMNSLVRFDKAEVEPPTYLRDWKTAAKGLAFREAYNTKTALRPDMATKTYNVHVMENRRLTPLTYERNIFHIEFDLGDSGLKYDIGEALGIHAENDEYQVEEFIRFYKLDPDEIVEVPSREDMSVLENRTVWQALMQNVDIFGRPPKRFYEALAEFADDPSEKQELQALGGPEGANEFKRRAEVDTITYADILLEYPSAHPSFHDIVRIVSPMKRREYSIASCQKVTPNSVALMIVVVGWVDPKGRDRFGQATRYLNKLRVGASVTVSVKPSVMKLPPKSTQPLIMAGLGTGLAPFRAFVQYRAWEKAQGKEIGSVLLYMGSRHQREEYCYGEEWEAYQDAGVITLLGRAFSRDQPQKIYIQDRMRQTMGDIIQAYLKEEGAFYLCGPTWPVPDVTNVLEDAIARDAKALGKRTDPHKEIERLKDQLRYVLEVSSLATVLARQVVSKRMPYRESSSPARRPQLTERSSSTLSLSRASPSTGKGSTTKLHRAHPVGHGRHPHGRAPSHGRSLNKLSKLVAAHPPEEHDMFKIQSRAKVPEPSMSLSTPDLQQSTSNLDLVRSGSKVSVKRNASNLSQKRNKSSSKLGNLTKTGKAGLERNGSDKADSSSAQFSIGTDDQDDGWTEADSSQSPSDTRHEPNANVKAQFRAPPSPHEQPLPSPTNLPASPPQSPPAPDPGDSHGHALGHIQGSSKSNSAVPDAEVMTQQLLDRNTALNAKPQTSAVSATFTAFGSSGSPTFNYSRDATLRNDPSMPPDGISRFLNARGSPSGGATPNSLSQLHTALAGIHGDHAQGNGTGSPLAPNGNTAGDGARRARSTADLTLAKREQRFSSQASSPPSQHRGGPSPFASARDHQSLTQLKLDLQRISTNQEPAHAPAVQPPTSGAHASFANLSLIGNERTVDERKQRQWDQAEIEYQNGRKFVGMVAKGLERLQKRGRFGGLKDGRHDIKERDGGRRGDRHVVVSTSADSRPSSRGRIRFEIGGSHGDDRHDADTDSDGGGLEGLLRRMWEGDGQSGGDD